jgi:hypothetical protein
MNDFKNPRVCDSIKRAFAAKERHTLAVSFAKNLQEYCVDHDLPTIAGSYAAAYH